MVVNTFSRELQKFGLGDFIQGSYGLYEICRKLNLNFGIDLSEHIIGDYIIQKIGAANKTKIIDITFRKDTDCLSQYIKKLHSLYSTNGYEHVRFYCDIPPTNEDDIKYNCDLHEYFMPNSRSEELIKNKFPCDYYNLIHIRCGDHNTFNKSNINSNIDNIIKSIEPQLIRIKNNSMIPFLLVSDSYELKKKLSNLYDFHIINNTPSHTIEYNNFFDEVALDFFLSCKAQSIHQFCVYKRPSGFSYWPHILFDIPFYYYNTISTFEE